MLGIVTIEAGFEVKDEGLKKYGEAFPDHLETNAPTSGFRTIHAVIDIRRVTTMLEIVRMCRPILPGITMEAFLSPVHFKMLAAESSRMMVSTMRRYDDRYELKCRKHVDRSTKNVHTLTVTVQAISVPRLSQDPL